MQIFYKWSCLQAGFCPGPSLELKAAGEAAMLAEVKEVWGLCGAGKRLCKSKGQSGLGASFLLNLTLQGLMQPLCWLPKAQTERLFWDTATPSVTSEMFGERFNKIN